MLTWVGIIKSDQVELMRIGQDSLAVTINDAMSGLNEQTKVGWVELVEQRCTELQQANAMPEKKVFKEQGEREVVQGC